MSRKIGIIGMGNVGAAVAHGAIAQDVYKRQPQVNRTES